jgi:hypothetical protein
VSVVDTIHSAVNPLKKIVKLSIHRKAYRSHDE